MGMFDTLGEVLFCPFCGKKQTKDDFQSKELGDTLSSWTFKEIKNVFTEKDRMTKIHLIHHCNKCKKRIFLTIRPIWLITKSKEDSQ